MKPIQLQLVGDGKILSKMDIGPVLGLRIIAFAKTNKVSVIDMISLALRFAVSPDGKFPDLSCPDEEDIVAIAAKMLMKPRRSRALARAQ